MFRNPLHRKSAAGRSRTTACTLWATSGVALVSLVGGAQAAEYVIQPSVSSRISMTDNLLLNRDGEEVETFILELSPRLRVSRSTEKWQAAFDATVTAERLEDDDFNSDNQDVSIQLTRRAETLQFDFVALNRRESTRLVEINQLGEPGFGVDRRDRQFVRPSARWTLNPTNQLTFGVSGENVHFGGTQFSDYDYLSADIGWSHQWDEKTNFELSAFGSEYTSVPPFARVDDFLTCVFGFDGIDEFGSETVGVQIGGSRQPNSRLRYRGSFGYRDVKNTNERQCIEIDGSLRIIRADATNDVFILDTGLTYQGERYGVDVSVSRSVTPVGLGFLTEQDNFSLSLTYRNTERITSTLSVTGFNTKSIDESFTFEREGFRVSPRVVWRIDEQLSVNGGIIYRSNETIQAPGEREGITTYIGVQKSFKTRRFTR